MKDYKTIPYKHLMAFCSTQMTFSSQSFLLMDFSSKSCLGPFLRSKFPFFYAISKQILKFNTVNNKFFLKQLYFTTKLKYL